MNAPETQTVALFDGRSSGVTAAYLDPETDRVFVASERTGLAVHDLGTRTATIVSSEKHGIRGMKAAPWGSFLLAWSHDGVAGTRPHSVWQWSLREPGRMDQLRSPLPIEDAAVLEDSRVAACSFETPDLMILSHGREPLFRPLHAAPITSVSFRQQSPLVTTSLDGTLGIWDPRALQPAGPRLEGHTDAVWGCLLLDDGWIVSFGADQTLRSWKLDSGRFEAVRVMRGHTDQITAIAPTVSGWVVSGSWDGTLRVWNFETAQQILSIPLGRGRITHIATSPSGRIAAATADRMITLVVHGEVAGVFPGPAPFTTVGLTNDVVFAGDVYGDLSVLDTGPIHERVQLPARLAILAMRDNLDIASEIARAVDYTGPQFVQAEPVDLDSLLDRTALRDALSPYPFVLLLACNKLADPKYRDILNEVRRGSIYRYRLEVAFEDAERWKGSGARLQGMYAWPSPSGFEALARGLRRTVWIGSTETGPYPDQDPP